MSYSVTVRTVFHKTRVDLQKWFYLAHLMFVSRELPPLRTLGETLSVTKDTASLMLKRIKNSTPEQRDLLAQINDTL
jgi:hypothetical protein